MCVLRVHFCVAMLALAGCSSSPAPSGPGTPPIPPDVTQSEILSSNDLRALQAVLDDAYSAPDMLTDPDRPYTLLAGFQPDVGVRTAAALGDNLAVAPINSTANAVMTGTYTILIVENITVVDGQLSGRTTPLNGNIALTADFESLTLTGTSEDSGDTLTIAAEMANSTLTGRVTYGDLGGTLTGKVGQDRAVAVFHGNSDDTAFVGGFDARTSNSAD